MKRSLKNIALVVTFGTLISKIGGFARQLVIAGTFGIGAAYDAYNYAYILPGFFLVLVGGINGPLHNAMVTVLSRKSIKEGEYLTSASITGTKSQEDTNKLTNQSGGDASINDVDPLTTSIKL